MGDLSWGDDKDCNLIAGKKLMVGLLECDGMQSKYNYCGDHGRKLVVMTFWWLEDSYNTSLFLVKNRWCGKWKGGQWFVCLYFKQNS